MCLWDAQSPFSLCCRYLGFFRAIGPITVAVLGIAITNIWHLECPTSDKNKVCVCARACVHVCVCVHKLFEAQGHTTCPFSMQTAVFNSLAACRGCKLALSSCMSALHSLLGLACKHSSPGPYLCKVFVHHVFCCAVNQICVVPGGLHDTSFQCQHLQHLMTLLQDGD